MMALTASNLSYILGILGLFSIVFSVYNHFKNPQIKTDQNSIKFQEELDSLKTQVKEIKEKHIASVEENIRNLSDTIHDLALNVTRLSTIIDERIPKSVK